MVSLSPEVIGLIGVVLGAVLNEGGAIIRTRWQEDAENTRTEAEFHLERRVEALTNLSSQLEETHRALNDNLGLDPEYEDKYWDEVQPQVAEFRNTVRQDGIFLINDEHDEIIHDALGQFRMASIHIQRQVTEQRNLPDNFDLQEFEDTYQEARSALKEELNRPIRELDD